MADSHVLPYSLGHFPKRMRDALDTMEANNVTGLMEANGATLDHLSAAVGRFSAAVDRHEQALKTMDLGDELKLRMANDQLMGLERVFVMPRGLPGRPDSRHAIFAPAKFNKYGASAFPGISDLLHEVEKLRGEEKEKRWEEMRLHLSDLMIMVDNAADFLSPVDQI